MDKPETQILEPVIGLRHWDVKPDGELYSPVTKLAWKPGVNHAECIKGRLWRPLNHFGLSPVANCSCGIYAHHEVTRTTNGIVGVIRGWGKVRVHPDGWRAEHAELLGIFQLNRSREELNAVAGRYNIPILPASFIDPQILSAEFGPWVPQEIRPQEEDSPSTSYMVADYLLWTVIGSITVGVVTIGSGAVRSWRQSKHSPIQS